MNARFSEYVTSGAFSLTLTRTQIAQLSMVEGGEVRYLPAAASLERKGLVEAIPEQPEQEIFVGSRAQSEWRLTGAGAITLALLAQAGLANSGVDVAAREIDDLRTKLAVANTKTADAFLRVRSMQARVGELEQQVEILTAKLEQRKFNLQLRLRDPLPGATLDELADADADVGEPVWASETSLATERTEA